MGVGKEVLHYLAAGVLVALMGGLVLFLTYIPIPEDNRDVITTLIGVFVMGGSMALPTLLGDSEAEKKKITEAAEIMVRRAEDQVSEVNARLDRMAAKYDVLKENYDELMELLVERHVVEGKGNHVLGGSMNNGVSDGKF